MATLNRHQLETALDKLGSLAHQQGTSIELILLGGTLMVLLFGTREATRDVDVKIVFPEDASVVRRLANQVAEEFGWDSDWLNDGAKGYLVGLSQGPVIRSMPGLVIRRPSIEQLLAMKLCAWRDDVDIDDARTLLGELSGTTDEIWNRVLPYLLPGRELKAKYAFADLWEQSHGAN